MNKGLNANQICEVDYNNMMEPLSEKEQSRNQPNGNGNTRGHLNPDYASEPLRPIHGLQRKISKRREQQEERNVVLDLFKELIGKVNEGYNRVIAAQNNKATISSKSTKTTKNKQRQKTKEIVARDNKQRARKSSSQEVEGIFQRKQQIWNNYSKLMTYQVLAQEPEIIQQPEPVPPVAQTQ